MGTRADDGDDMTISPWVFEHGQHMPAVLVAECDAPDVWILGPGLVRDGFTHPARVGVRPATVPGWRAVYRLSPPELTMTHANGVQFYVGELPELPERWAYSARELGWCVLYIVMGVLPERVDPYTDYRALAEAARKGSVFAGRIAIHEACFLCGEPATRRVIVSKMDGESMRYVCCESCEPRHIPQGEIVTIKTEPLP